MKNTVKVERVILKCIYFDLHMLFKASKYHVNRNVGYFFLEC